MAVEANLYNRCYHLDERWVINIDLAPEDNRKWSSRASIHNVDKGYSSQSDWMQGWFTPSLAKAHVEWWVNCELRALDKDSGNRVLRDAWIDALQGDIVESEGWKALPF